MARRIFHSPYESPSGFARKWAAVSKRLRRRLIYYIHKKSLASAEIDSRRGGDEETPVHFSGSAYKRSAGRKWYLFFFFSHSERSTARPAGRWPTVFKAELWPCLQCFARLGCLRRWLKTTATPPSPIVGGGEQFYVGERGNITKGKGCNFMKKKLMAKTS